jgi:hypothetical protein
VESKAKNSKVAHEYAEHREHDEFILVRASGESLFFEDVEVDATCLFGLSFLVELDPWSSEGDVSR